MEYCGILTLLDFWEDHIQDAETVPIKMGESRRSIKKSFKLEQLIGYLTLEISKINGQQMVSNLEINEVYSNWAYD